MYRELPAGARQEAQTDRIQPASRVPKGNILRRLRRVRPSPREGATLVERLPA